MHAVLRRHLLPPDGRESAALLLCQKATGRQRTRLIGHEVVLIADETCNERTAISVNWTVDDYLPPDKVTEIEQQGMSIISLHSHPRGVNAFSSTDDINDRRLFGSINGWFDDRRPHGSAVMVRGGRMFGRVVKPSGEFVPMANIVTVGERLKFWGSADAPVMPLAGERIAQAFGKNTLRQLRKLRVGVVGCSGTGSVMIELLARNCVGNLMLVDPDHVGVENLNRIVNANVNDAEDKLPKVEVLARAVESMGTGTKVDTYQKATHSKEVVEALLDCDVIFGCVDSAEGRYHLDIIASACQIPYFDVGVSFALRDNGRITDITAVSNYVRPGGAYLKQRGVYRTEQVTAEGLRRENPEHYKMMLEKDYLPLVDENQPAVMSVNMQASCMAFNDFLARLHGFRLDPDSEFSKQQFRLVHGSYETESDELADYELFDQYSGLGDESFLLAQLKD